MLSLSKTNSHTDRTHACNSSLRLHRRMSAFLLACLRRNADESDQSLNRHLYVHALLRLRDSAGGTKHRQRDAWVEKELSYVLVFFVLRASAGDACAACARVTTRSTSCRARTWSRGSISYISRDPFAFLEISVYARARVDRRNARYLNLLWSYGSVYRHTSHARFNG